jgi:hypothetical protein
MYGPPAWVIGGSAMGSAFYGPGMTGTVLHSIDQFCYIAQGMATTQASGQNKIGPLAFYYVGDLLAANILEFFRFHIGAGQNPLSLQKIGRTGHRSRITAFFAPAFKQQGDIKDHQGQPPGLGISQKGSLHLPHHGMKDRLQLTQFLTLSKNLGTQSGTVNRTVFSHAGKGCFNPANGTSPLYH